MALKNNPSLHAILQPCHPGCSFSQLLNGHLARKEEKMLANHMFWQLMVSYTHLLLLLKTPVMWLSIVAFNNAAKPKWILREFDVSRTQARLDGLPHLETLHGKIWTLLRGLPGLVDRFTRFDRSPHLSCQHDQIKLRDYMDRQVTLPNRVTSHTWGPPPPCKHATSKSFGMGPTWFAKNI